MFVNTQCNKNPFPDTHVLLYLLRLIHDGCQGVVNGSFACVGTLVAALHTEIQLVHEAQAV